MEHVMYAITLLFASAAGSLVGAVWEGAVLAAAVALFLRLLPGISAAARSIVWTTVLLLLVLFHFVAVFGGKSNAAQVEGSMIHVDLRWSIAIACVWGIFSLVRGAQLIRSALGLRKIARRAMPLRSEIAFSIPGSCRYRPVELCTSAEVDRPCVVGFFSPRILLPAALMEKLSLSDMDQIVLHEMEHLRRADDWTNLLQKVSLVLFPLNPVLLWVERRLCVERELACDDSVLHSTKARKAYAACLTNLAEHVVLQRGASLALGAWERQSELSRRVHRILQRPENVMGSRQVKLVTSALLLSLLGGSVMLAHSPQLVSFAPLSQTHASVHAALLSSSRLVQTAYSRSTATPTLVKAVLPQQRSTEAVLTTRQRRHNAAVRSAYKRPATQVSSWVVLTEWREVSMPARITFAVSQGTRSSYAAVPMANGWLIVQL